MKKKSNDSWYRELLDSLELYLYIQPGAKKNEIIGLHADRLKIKLVSLPQDGKANKALISFLSAQCGVPPSRFELKKGAKSRIKTIIFQGAPHEILSFLKKKDKP